MRRFILIFLAGFIFFSLYAGRAYACYYLDWSDAPSGYPSASNEGRNSNASWQWLGLTWNADSGAMHNDEDTSDDGIWWSTDNSSWGHPSVVPGQDIWLKFQAKEARWNFWQDYIRIWIDWNRDDDWSDNGESVWSYAWLDGSLGAATITKTKKITVPSYASMGTTWLRARISCSWMGPTGYNNQGEVEDWRMDVIPEPMSFILLGSGLLGLAGFRLKKFRRKE